MLNLGTVYPQVRSPPSSFAFVADGSLQVLLIFTLGLTYSIIAPMILPFTTLYFGLAYLVYKYKLLFVYCELTRIPRRRSAAYDYTRRPTI